MERLTQCRFFLLPHPAVDMQSDRSPLHWAASEGDSGKVAELLEQKVDVDPVDEVRESLIFLLSTRYALLTIV